MAAPGADDPTSGDDEPQVVQLRRHQLLRERTVPPKPPQRPDVIETRTELLRISTEEHIAPPTAEARLDHERRVQRNALVLESEMDGRGVRDLRASKQLRGLELVVCAQQRRSGVQHAHAALSEDIEDVQAVFDPVQRRQDVEAPDRDVAGLQRAQRSRRAEGERVDPCFTPNADKRGVRFLRFPADHADAHLPPPQPGAPTAQSRCNASQSSVT